MIRRGHFYLKYNLRKVKRGLASSYSWLFGVSIQSWFEWKSGSVEGGFKGVESWGRRVRGGFGGGEEKHRVWGEIYPKKAEEGSGIHRCGRTKTGNLA